MAMNLQVDPGFLTPQMPPRTNVQAPQGDGRDFRKVMDLAQSRKEPVQTAERKEASAADKHTSQDDKGVSAEKPTENRVSEKTGKSALQEKGAVRPDKAGETAAEEPEEVTDPEKAGELYAALLNLLQANGVDETQLQAAMEELQITPAELSQGENLANLIGMLMPENPGQPVNPLMVAEELIAEVYPKDPGVTEELSMEPGMPEGQAGAMTEDGAFAGELSLEQDSSRNGFLDSLNESAEADEQTGFRALSQEETASLTAEELLPETEAPAAGKAADAGENSSSGNQVGSQAASAGTEKTAVEEVPKEAPVAPFAEQLNLNDQPAEVGAPQSVPAQTVDVQDIMEQVNGMIRSRVTPEVSEVELQLHPASLGTINITLQARENGVTAQFTAQDESVRAALEGQIAQLREQLTNAGIKIEAVAVTVESHAFEQNLQQGNDQAGDQAGGEPSRKRGIRRLTLQQIEGLLGEEELSEEDQLAAEMMRANGGNVDYLA